LHYPRCVGLDEDSSFANNFGRPLSERPATAPAASTTSGWAPSRRQGNSADEALARGCAPSRRRDRDRVAHALSACGRLHGRGDCRIICCGATTGGRRSGRASRPRPVPGPDRRDLRADVSARSTSVPTESRPGSRRPTRSCDTPRPRTAWATEIRQSNAAPRESRLGCFRDPVPACKERACSRDQRILRTFHRAGGQAVPAWSPTGRRWHRRTKNSEGTFGRAIARWRRSVRDARRPRPLAARLLVDVLRRRPLSHTSARLDGIRLPDRCEFARRSLGRSAGSPVDLDIRGDGSNRPKRAAHRLRRRSGRRCLHAGASGRVQRRSTRRACCLVPRANVRAQARAVPGDAAIRRRRHRPKATLPLRRDRWRHELERDSALATLSFARQTELSNVNNRRNGCSSITGSPSSASAASSYRFRRPSRRRRI
jgi:hypothetical protein